MDFQTTATRNLVAPTGPTTFQHWVQGSGKESLGRERSSESLDADVIDALCKEAAAVASGADIDERSEDGGPEERLSGELEEWQRAIKLINELDGVVEEEEGGERGSSSSTGSGGYPPRSASVQCPAGSLRAPASSRTGSAPRQAGKVLSRHQSQVDQGRGGAKSLPELETGGTLHNAGAAGLGGSMRESRGSGGGLNGHSSGLRDIPAGGQRRGMVKVSSTRERVEGGGRARGIPIPKPSRTLPKDKNSPPSGTHTPVSTAMAMDLRSVTDSLFQTFSRSGGKGGRLVSSGAASWTASSAGESEKGGRWRQRKPYHTSGSYDSGGVARRWRSSARNGLQQKLMAQVLLADLSAAGEEVVSQVEVSRVLGLAASLVDQQPVSSALCILRVLEMVGHVDLSAGGGEEDEEVGEGRWKGDDDEDACSLDSGDGNHMVNGNGDVMHFGVSVDGREGRGSEVGAGPPAEVMGTGGVDLQQYMLGKTRRQFAVSCLLDVLRMHERKYDKFKRRNRRALRPGARPATPDGTSSARPPTFAVHSATFPGDAPSANPSHAPLPADSSPGAEQAAGLPYTLAELCAVQLVESTSACSGMNPVECAHLDRLYLPQTQMLAQAPAVNLGPNAEWGRSAAGPGSAVTTASVGCDGINPRVSSSRILLKQGSLTNKVPPGQLLRMAVLGPGMVPAVLAVAVAQEMASLPSIWPDDAVAIAEAMEAMGCWEAGYRALLRALGSVYATEEDMRKVMRRTAAPRGVEGLRARVKRMVAVVEAAATRAPTDTARAAYTARVCDALMEPLMDGAGGERKAGSADRGEEGAAQATCSHDGCTGEHEGRGGLCSKCHGIVGENGGEGDGEGTCLPDEDSSAAHRAHGSSAGDAGGGQTEGRGGGASSPLPSPPAPSQECQKEFAEAYLRVSRLLALQSAEARQLHEAREDRCALILLRYYRPLVRGARGVSPGAAPSEARAGALVVVEAEEEEEAAGGLTQWEWGGDVDEEKDFLLCLLSVERQQQARGEAGVPLRQLWASPSGEQEERECVGLELLGWRAIVRVVERRDANHPALPVMWARGVLVSHTVSGGASFHLMSSPLYAV